MISEESFVEKNDEVIDIFRQPIDIRPELIDIGKKYPSNKPQIHSQAGQSQVSASKSYKMGFTNLHFNRFGTID